MGTKQPSIDALTEIGNRIKRLRQLSGLSQAELAARIDVSTGLMSHIEKGRSALPPGVLEAVSNVVDCEPEFITYAASRLPATRPWLRAYADAPQKDLARHIGEAENLADAVGLLGLRRVPVALPVFDGDLADMHAIEEHATYIRALSEIDETAVIGNTMRLAERLGCVFLPMRNELGRHLGMSTRIGDLPVICISRPSMAPDRQVPGDRQRLTVAHELGHLVLHSALAMPSSPEELRSIERQAFRFAAALLAPAEAMYEELEGLDGRVTLSNLSSIKSRWGVSVKMLVGRFKDMNVVSEDQARSLYKQISARGWNKGEPIFVGNESAIWLQHALLEFAQTKFVPEATAAASRRTGLGVAHFERWLNWSSVEPNEPPQMASVVPINRNRTSVTQ